LPSVFPPPRQHFAAAIERDEDEDERYEGKT